VSGGADVLVVDDETVVCDAVARVLGASGLTVAAAGDGRSALAHPALASCRIAFCDLVLPDVPGIEVVEALRRARPDLPVVVITGYATADSLRRAVDAGAAGVLPKPFDEAELLAALRHALGAGKEGPS
jgi:CheY-like chemotaxis protein